MSVEGPLRVAIDGVDGAGKTTMADELATYLRVRGRTIIRSSVDGFHRPRAERYRRGPDSPEGFYKDSFDYTSLREALLDPLGPGGNRRYRTRTFDVQTDTAVDEPERTAPEDAILIFDGIFSQRPELAEAWDLQIFLDVPFEETLRRSLVRDRTPTSTPGEIERRFWARYAAGQAIYLQHMQPRERADILIDNSNPAKPVPIRTTSEQPVICDG